MKLKDDDIALESRGDVPTRERMKQRRKIVLVACPACSLLLVVCMIVDSLPRRFTHGEQPQRMPLTAERTLETMERLGADLATGSWPASREYGKVPCAINVTGYTCPAGYGAAMNALYLLEQGSGAAALAPVYRSLEGYWLVHSPHRCFERAIWLISRTRPDESDQSANAPHGDCDLEAHIFHSARLPVGNLVWSYVSCGAAGDANVGRRRLMLEPVQQCDCPTAGHASRSETDAATPSLHGARSQR